MAKTWTNYACSFSTRNDSNTLADSKYFISGDAMVRIAFVNAGPRRDMNQTRWVARRSVCYLDPTSGLYLAAMRQADDSKITVVAVVGDTIHIRVDGVPHGGNTIGPCSRVPENGLVPFDFVNNAGVLSHIHIGHPVHNVSAGIQAPEVLAELASLEKVKTQVAAKGNVLQQLLQRTPRVV